MVEEALLWLRWLEKDDARIVWLRANGKPWRKIFGLDREAGPTKRSMEFVINHVN